MARRSNFRQATINPLTSGYRPKAPVSLRLPPIPWAAAVLAIGAVVLGWFVLGSGKFTVRSVIVTGSVNDGVNQALMTLKGKNILLLSIGGLERSLPHQQSSIDSLHIIKGFPDTLRVDVAVRQPLIRWRTGDQEAYLDQSGVLFSLDPKPVASAITALPVVIDAKHQPLSLGQPIVTGTFVSFVSDLHQKFHERTGLVEDGLTVGETTRELDVATANHFTIRFDTSRTLDPQLSTLSAILAMYGSAIHESIDLRVEGRVFYR